jgi:hypothetical protein
MDCLSYRSDFQVMRNYCVPQITGMVARTELLRL